MFRVAQNQLISGCHFLLRSPTALQPLGKAGAGRFLGRSSRDQNLFALRVEAQVPPREFDDPPPATHTPDAAPDPLVPRPPDQFVKARVTGHDRGPARLRPLFHQEQQPRSGKVTGSRVAVETQIADFIEQQKVGLEKRTENFAFCNTLRAEGHPQIEEKAREAAEEHHPSAVEQFISDCAGEVGFPGSNRAPKIKRPDRVSQKFNDQLPSTGVGALFAPSCEQGTAVKPWDACGFLLFREWSEVLDLHNPAPRVTGIGLAFVDIEPVIQDFRPPLRPFG